MTLMFEVDKFNQLILQSWQILLIPITNTLPIVVATLATGAAQAKYGIYEWNAADLFLLWNNRAAQFFCSACFILSNIGINISANAVYVTSARRNMCTQPLIIKQSLLERYDFIMPPIFQ